jgi:tetratricopeptide (TPR) repeat protein
MSNVRQGEQDIRRLKERAHDFFKKGRFSEAVAAWAEVCAADQKDDLSRVRWGDALVAAGQKAPAYEAYRLAAHGFARQGLTAQAIAAAKLALNLNPSDEAVGQLLTDFHAERFGATEAVPGPLSDEPPVGPDDDFGYAATLVRTPSSPDSPLVDPQPAAASKEGGGGCLVRLLAQPETHRVPRRRSPNALQWVVTQHATVGVGFRHGCPGQTGAAF